MSIITFNDDIVFDLPWGWACRESREEGDRVLRIAGPDAGAGLFDGDSYECDLSLKIGKTMEKPLREIDFPAKLKEISDKAPDIKISVSVSSSFGESRSKQIGGGFDRVHRVLIDSPSIKTGYFTMGILGKTACIGVIMTEKHLYMLMPLKSRELTSSLRHMPVILGGVALAHAPTETGREAQRPAQTGGAPGLRSEIMDYMEFDTLYTAGDIAAGVGLSENRVTPALTQLCAEGKLVKCADKKGNIYYCWDSAALPDDCERYKTDILNNLEEYTLYSAEDIGETVPSIERKCFSAEQVTAMLTQLCEEGRLEKSDDKGKVFYSLP